MKNIVNLYYLEIDSINKEKIISSLLLTSDELSYLKSIKIEKVYNEKLLSTYLKRYYIKDYFLSEYNKPLSNNIFFNISHSDNLIVLATSKYYEIGVDVERIKYVDDKVKRRVSDAYEYDELSNDSSFIKFWTAKESLVKAKGTGFIKDIKKINAYPFDGIKEYMSEKYYSHILKIDDYIISITLKTDNDFKIIKKKISSI
ncbi:4'-phosphopantetheinyl transferase superfamily protein [bacterium]|nr:4'-phosphopantetheinyl transferase superfamily protein [bacterium]